MDQARLYVAGKDMQKVRAEKLEECKYTHAPFLSFIFLSTSINKVVAYFHDLYLFLDP